MRMTTMTRMPCGQESKPWRARYTRAANMRANAKPYTHQGRTQSLAEWAAEVGLNRQCLASRVTAGWDFERALRTPSRRTRPVIVTLHPVGDYGISGAFRAWASRPA